MSDPIDDSLVLQVRNLCKYYPIFSRGLVKKKIGDVKAVDDVSFELRRGETLGLVGESGCGKTTCARAILRAITPTSGQVLFHREQGVVDLAKIPETQMKPLRREIQMVFQDPMASLNPRMTVGQIVEEPLVIHRMGSRRERETQVVEMLEKVGLLPEHRCRYPHAFSGGQRQRISIARALILKPSLVVCDEAVSALDVSIQAQVINLLQDLQEEFGLTYIFVAHDLSVVRHISTNVAVMYAGKVVETGTGAELFDNPQHPYTRSLLSAIPYPNPRKRMKVIPYNPESVAATTRIVKS